MLNFRVLFARNSQLLRTCQFANGQQRVLASTKGTVDEDQNQTKQMSQRAKVVAQRMGRNVKGSSAKKILKLATSKDRSIFEVHEKMSIVDLSRYLSTDCQFDFFISRRIQLFFEN